MINYYEDNLNAEGILVDNDFKIRCEFYRDMIKGTNILEIVFEQDKTRISMYRVSKSDETFFVDTIFLTKFD